MFPCSTVPAEIILAFEPYLEMSLSTIQELWNEKEEKRVISKRFLSTFGQNASEKLLPLIKIIVGCTASSKVDGDQLYQILLKWRDSDMDNQKTYLDLCSLVNQYSVFAGRNVLVSLSFVCVRPCILPH